MQFNRFIFDNYLATEEGKNALAFFNDFENVFRQKKVKPYFEFLNHTLIDNIGNEEKCAEILEEQNYKIDELEYIVKRLSLKKELKSKTNLDTVIEKSKKVIDELVIANSWATERDLLLGYLCIESYSIEFYFLYPQIFFPYFFRYNFNQLEKIFREFSIPLPSLPRKRKYKERFNYYFDLCCVFYDFRKEYNLSPQEFCVFLYYFAPHITEPIILKNDLPEATKVYIGACSINHTELLNNYTNESMDIWSGNENMQAGDIILMYEISPVSAIRSVFRCITKGFFDPFDYYSERVWIGKMQRIQSITFKDLKNNEIWKNNSYVHAKMQGVGGTPCTVEEYDAIKEMLKAKGFDTSILPNLQYTGLPNNIELKVEKDAEELLLEPLLKKIGFTKNNWKRQLSVRMGRGERNYPDYALFPKGTKGEETAWFLWEAKLTIHNRKELLDAFLQAKSYALRLESVGFGLVAREGVWLSFKKDGFLFEKIISYTWADLANTDKFNEFMLMTKR